MHDFVDCTGNGPTNAIDSEYCLDKLARGALTVMGMCGPCLARTMPQLDMAAGRDLAWPEALLDRANAPAPTPLQSYRHAPGIPGGAL